jgi:hypothetical protein
MRFLHAYSVFGFRDRVGYKHPAQSLASWVFEIKLKRFYPYSGFSVLPDRVPPDLAPGKHLAYTSKV